MQGQNDLIKINGRSTNSLTMANELIYTGSVTNGILKIVNRKGFDQDMSMFEGKRLILRVKQYRKSRSSKQNAYYHGFVLPYVADGLVNMGFERSLLSGDNVHHLLRDKFLKVDIAVSEGDHSGEFVTMVKSTTDLSTTEFSNYIDEIQRWASEFLGVYIPDPNEQAEIEY